MSTQRLDVPEADRPGHRPEGEERFLALADVAPALIWITDTDGYCTWLNRTWLEFTGRPLADEAGRGWMEDVHPDDQERCSKIYRAAFDRREPFELEFRMRHKDGGYRWLMSRANAVFLPKGDFDGYIGSCVEIEGRRRTEEALRFLADTGAQLSRTLDYDETLEQLPPLAVPRFADWCTVMALEEGGALRRVACAHREREKLPLLEQLVDSYGARDVTNDHIVARVVQSGRAELAAAIDAEAFHTFAADEQHFELLRQLQPCSALCVPLVARGRTMGALMFVRVAGNVRYDAGDLAVAEELAGRAALAADNARLYTQAQRANGALQLLADAASELASSLGYDETLANLARLVVPRFADWCTIDVLNPDDSYRRVVVAHKDPEMVELARQLQERYRSDEVDAAYVARLRAGEIQFYPTISDELLVQAARDAKQLQLLRSLGLTSVIVAPLSARGRAFGAISFILSESGRHYDEADVAVAEQMGRRAGLFVDNARLYEESQRIESELLKANQSLRLVADVGMQLGVSLDYSTTVASVPGLAIPSFADCSWIDLVDPDGSIRRTAIEHRDAGMRERLQVLAAHPPAPASRAAALVRQGASQCFPDASTAPIVPGFAPAEVQAAVAELRPRSLIRVPLRARGRVFGALAFLVTESSGRTYSQADLSLAEDVGSRAALFMDNARLYTEAQTTEAELRRANEAKDQFLSMMSHELRTPLTVINGGARILRARAKQLDEATQGAIITDIEGESDRLFRMVENLLSMAHIEYTEELSVEPVLPRRLLDRVIEAFHQRRPDRVVNLSVEEDLGALAAEPTYLEQVVRNLMSNADKYSPAGTEIDIRVQRAEDNMAAISVLDRGVGIDPAEAELIFQRFYRSERTAKLIGGSGVGLALCKRLVEAMSGRMWAAPRDGGGLVVGFTLPRYEEAL